MCTPIGEGASGTGGAGGSQNAPISEELGRQLLQAFADANYVNFMMEDYANGSGAGGASDALTPTPEPAPVNPFDGGAGGQSGSGGAPAPTATPTYHSHVVTILPAPENPFAEEGATGQHGYDNTVSRVGTDSDCSICPSPKSRHRLNHCVVYEEDDGSAADVLCRYIDQAPTASISAPSTAVIGNTVTVSWSCGGGANSCKTSWGASALSSSKTFDVGGSPRSVTLSVTAANHGGDTETDSVTVSVVAPTPAPATATPTPTPVPATATPTPVPATATPTPVPATATPTPIPAPQASMSITPSSLSIGDEYRTVWSCANASLCNSYWERPDGTTTSVTNIALSGDKTCTVGSVSQYGAWQLHVTAIAADGRKDTATATITLVEASETPSNTPTPTPTPVAPSASLNIHESEVYPDNNITVTGTCAGAGVTHLRLVNSQGTAGTHVASTRFTQTYQSPDSGWSVGSQTISLQCGRVVSGEFESLASDSDSITVRLRCCS